MGAAYRKGYEAFQAADHDPQAGDKAVQGMDREPSKLLDEAAELIAKASADTAGQAAQRASQATTVSLIVMLAVCAASVVGALLFSRSVVRPIGQAVQVSQAVAKGDLTVATPSAGRDEIAQLLNALHDMQGSLALVVRSLADRLARSVGPDTLPYPLLCDADGVLYDLLDIPTRSGALSTYSLEAWQIMRDAKRRGYHSPANGQQQRPLTLVLDKDGTVLFSHYGASLTDVPADCGAAQSLLEDLDVAKPVDVDDADVTIYADPGAAPDIPGLTPHVHEYAQPNLGETGVFSVFDDAYKDEE